MTSSPDPNVLLFDIRAALSTLDSLNANERSREAAYAILPERIAALDEWLSRGGALPDAWGANRTVVPVVDLSPSDP